MPAARFPVVLLALVGNYLGLPIRSSGSPNDAPPPHIVLVMADDQGWGEVGYRGHPVLKTPHLDRMAAAGLRFDRFYAGGPVCSPTRATVLTGRTHDRCGVRSHGYALRRQEKTLAQALRTAGYRTGHFGKWHLNGLRGPGVPVLAADDHNPGAFGFEHWLSVTNFFDRDPILSRNGRFEEFHGDSSEIVVDEALKFIAETVQRGRPSFTVIWFGTPHSPFRAAPEDMQAFAHLDAASKNHYGELVAMDRAMGTLEQGLRRIGVADNTLVWFCSDNGGLPKITPDTVGGLRGYKGSLYEGGLRVPAFIYWPAGIPRPHVTTTPACTMDIFPTIAELVGLSSDACLLSPIDGQSLVGWFASAPPRREKPIPFHYGEGTSILDNNYKLIEFSKNNKLRYELYDVQRDPTEQDNLVERMPHVAQRLQRALREFQQSLQQSIDGADYPEGRVLPGEPAPRFWTEVDAYRPYFDQWRHRPEYASRLADIVP
ncbi:MAG: N-acetylgalactosamine-6-sulfatase [Pirellulaceae bacterium]|nr:MAG: N-acetylgalactosamine-6-sulfatase [Pirellulaceae bacterium]